MSTASDPAKDIVRDGRTFSRARQNHRGPSRKAGMARMASFGHSGACRRHGVVRRGRRPLFPREPESARTAHERDHGNEVTRSTAVAVNAPVGDVAEAPRRFDWPPVARAVRYRVRVDRHEILSVASSAAEGPTPSVRASIVQAERCLGMLRRMTRQARQRRIRSAIVQDCPEVIRDTE